MSQDFHALFESAFEEAIAANMVCHRVTGWKWSGFLRGIARSGSATALESAGDSGGSSACSRVPWRRYRQLPGGPHRSPGQWSRCIIVDYKSGQSRTSAEADRQRRPAAGAALCAAVREAMGLKTMAMIYLGHARRPTVGWGSRCRRRWMAWFPCRRTGLTTPKLAPVERLADFLRGTFTPNPPTKPVPLVRLRRYLPG